MFKAQILLRLLKLRRELRRRERWDRERLESYQSRTLDRLRAFVYPRSPFYREFHKGRYQASLQELPILTKSMMMENFDDLVTDRSIRLKEIGDHLARIPEKERHRGRYWASFTSGSAGSPGVYLFNDKEWAVVLASAIRSYEWAGVRVRPLRRARAAAIVSSNPSEMSSQVTATFHFWWFPTLRLFPDDALPGNVERLNAWQPEILQGFSEAIELLAEEQLAGRLRISPGSSPRGAKYCPRPNERTSRLPGRSVPSIGMPVRRPGSWLRSAPSIGDYISTKICRLWRWWISRTAPLFPVIWEAGYWLRP